MRRVVIIAVGLLLALSGCSTYRHTNYPMTQAERRACLRDGGRYEFRGYATEVCVHDYADGGKACSDGTDCQGECVFSFDGPGPYVPAPRHGVTGRCQRHDQDLEGCRGLVVKGDVLEQICE